MYTIEYNNDTAEEHLLYVENRPAIPSAVEDVKEYNIAGNDGIIYVHDGTIQDIHIPVTFSFVSEPEEWSETYRMARRWLRIKPDSKLILGDDSQWYYKVKHLEINTEERTARIIGKFTVVFVCEGYSYLRFYDSETTEKVLYNQFDVSHPVYSIIGEGVCTLTVNGKKMSANIGQNLTIDTERKISYRKDGTIINTAVTGDYESLYLNEGDNVLSITSGFLLKTNPKWRIRA